MKLRNGEHACVYVVIEHASSVDPCTGFRLLRYQIRVWEDEMDATRANPGRLPAIYAVVVYPGKTPWTAVLTVVDMVTGTPVLRSQLRDFGYRLRDSARMRSDRLAGHCELKDVLLTLKHGYRDRVALRVVLSIEELVPEGTKLARRTRRYILARFNTDRDKLEAVRKAKGMEPVGELADSCLSRGRAEVRVEGRLCFWTGS